MKALLPLLLLVPMVASADSPFDGTWVGKLDSATFDKKPDVVLVDKGMYQNSGFTPPVKVKADGTDQPVAGHAYFDTLAVKVLGPDSVELTMKKAGKVSYVNTTTVAADGKTATLKWSDQTGTSPATGEYSMDRVKSGPKGSNAVSGSWRAGKIEDASANGNTLTFKATADGMTMSTPTGQSYDAKFDGKYYLTAGDPGQTMVSLKKVSAHTMVETDKRLGKVVWTGTWTVNPDGKSMSVVWQEKLSGHTGSFVYTKSS